MRQECPSIALFASALTLCCLLSSCVSWLPESHSETTTFENFEQARRAIESLVPMQSDRQALKDHGFDLAQHPNTTILTHADVARLFLPSALLRREDLDPGILACLEARDACRGLDIRLARVHRQRTGGFWSDFFNFQRHTQTTGWRFNAVVLFVNDKVVYRTWGGQPELKEQEEVRNPLGPFQDIGPAQANTAVIPK